MRSTPGKQAGTEQDSTGGLLILIEDEVKVDDIDDLDQGDDGAKDEHDVCSRPANHENHLAQVEGHGPNCVHVHERPTDDSDSDMGRLYVVDEEDVDDACNVLIQMPVERRDS